MNFVPRGVDGWVYVLTGHDLGSHLKPNAHVNYYPAPPALTSKSIRPSTDSTRQENWLEKIQAVNPISTIRLSVDLMHDPAEGNCLAFVMYNILFRNIHVQKITDFLH